MGIKKQKVTVKWSNKTKKHYEEKGYKFTKIKDEFEVDISDLYEKSRIKVLCECDFCKKEFYQPFGRAIGTVKKELKSQRKICCAKCKQKKIKEVNMEKYGVEYPLQSKKVFNKTRQSCLEHYGVENPFQAKEVKEKIKATCLERYGVDNPAKAEEVQNKMKTTCLKRYGVEWHVFLMWNNCNLPLSLEAKKKFKATCLERYGVENPMQSKEIQNKIKATCLERYGVENPFQAEEVKEKIKATWIKKYGCDHPMKNQEYKENLLDKVKDTCLKKYGVEYPMLSPEMHIKANYTSYINQSGPSSRQQKYIYNILKEKENCKLNYPVLQLKLDIANPETKIYIEYDGSGHRLGIKYNGITEEEFNKGEMRRQYFLKNRGWKLIRILSKKDYLPTPEDLNELINICKDNLKNHSWIILDIDNKKIYNKEITIPLDYEFYKIHILEKMKKI